MSKKLLPDVLKGDKRATALAELIEKSRQETQEFLPFLFIYNLSTLSNSELEDLAWQFDVSKTAWELAQDRRQKEELIKNAIILKMKLGTPWAVKKILQILGFSVEIIEWFGTGGNLPPHTFALSVNRVPKNVKEIISVISDYKPASAHLAILTDGNCRNRLNLDRSCKLSRTLLSSLDGVKKEGVRFCFVEKKESDFEFHIQQPLQAVETHFYARHFPISRMRLDSFSLSKVTAEIPHGSSHGFILSDGYELKSSCVEDFYLQTNCNLVLSAGKLSEKGFQGSRSKGKGFKLSEGKLGSKPYEVVPLTCKPPLTSSESFEVPAPSAGSSLSCVFEEMGGETPPNLSRGLSLSSSNRKPIGSSVSFSFADSLTAPRYWVGSWKGTWEDSYAVSVESEVIHSEKFSALSGKASLSKDFSTPLPVFSINSVLGSMKLSSETPRFSSWRN